MKSCKEKASFSGSLVRRWIAFKISSANVENDDGIGGAFDPLAVFPVRDKVVCSDLIPVLRRDKGRVGKLARSCVLPGHLSTDAGFAKGF